jgi:hypothetical protein
MNQTQIQPREVSEWIEEITKKNALDELFEGRPEEWRNVPANVTYATGQVRIHPVGKLEYFDAKRWNFM